MVKYWQQAQDNIAVLPLQDGWGKKHQLFIKWKFLESKAAAYYFHGLILDEGNTEKSHRAAAAALHASEEYEMVGLEQSIGELKIIHVAGTKGKGSTCTFSEAILRECGLRTGLLTSPHLIDVRERIRINRSNYLRNC